MRSLEARKLNPRCLHSLLYADGLAPGLTRLTRARVVSSFDGGGIKAHAAASKRA